MFATRPSLNLKQKINDIRLVNAGAPTEHEIPAIYNPTDKIPVPTGANRDNIDVFCSGLNMMLKTFGALVTFEHDGNWYTVLHVQKDNVDWRYIDVTYKDYLGQTRIQPVVRFTAFKIFGGI